MTLIEILVVLAILSVILSISVAVYRQVGGVYTLPATASHVSSIIRAARNYSVSSGAPSKVFVDSKNQKVTAFGFQLVANWHFEDERPGENLPFPPGTEILGALRDRATVEGSVYGVVGKIGQALYFEDAGAIVADDQARYACSSGFSVDAWILFHPGDERPEALYTVVWKDGSFELGTQGDGAVFASIWGQRGNDPDPREYLVRTRPGTVRNDRWTHLRFIHDGLEIRIEVNGVVEEWLLDGYEHVMEEDTPEVPRRVAQTSAYLSVSRPDQFFMGAIDEVKYRVALEPKSYELPGAVLLLAPSQTIRFDTRGALDPIFHTRPVLVSMTRDAEIYEQSVDAGRHSIVVSRQELEGGGDPAASGEEQSTPAGDPVASLVKYLQEEQQRRAAEEADGQSTENSEADTVEGTEKAKRLPVPAENVREIIVDMTGTVRG